MSPETFSGHVRQYCEWAGSNTHDMGAVHRILRALMEGAASLKASGEPEAERAAPGLPQEVPWSETKRFADFPFQCYPVVFWPEVVHPEGPFTENIHEDFVHIYAELRHGLQALEAGDLKRAAGYWRDSYFFHWGHHASSAIWAIEWHVQRTPGATLAPESCGAAASADDGTVALG